MRLFERSNLVSKRRTMRHFGNEFSNALVRPGLAVLEIKVKRSWTKRRERRVTEETPLSIKDDGRVLNPDFFFLGYSGY